MKFSSILVGVLSLASVNAFADCGNFAGLYQNGTKLMKIEQVGCDKITRTYSDISNGAIGTEDIFGGDASVGSFWSDDHTGMSSYANFLNGTFFGDYQVNVSNTSARVYGASDSYSLDSVGNLIETEIFSDSANPPSPTVVTTWTKTKL
jgi:hypothetical protein